VDILRSGNEKGTGPICAKPGTDRRLVAGRSGKLDLSPFRCSFFLGLVLLERACAAALPGFVDAVVDVSLRPDGSLTGRVVDFSGGGQDNQDNVAVAQVELLGGRQTVALDRTDRQGQFRFENVRPGPYRLVVRRGGESTRWFIRAWSVSSAPPHAKQGMVVPVGGLIVRGQHAIVLPAVSLRQAATVTGLVAGAVAAPMIYHNSLVDNRVPASP